MAHTRPDLVMWRFCHIQHGARHSPETGAALGCGAMAVCHRNIIREEQIMSEPEIVKELDEIEALFVQTSLAAEHVDGRIILRSVTPSTLYFSDRPQRVVGHIGTPQFVDIWGVGENNFAEDPPNAVLAFLPQGMETPRDVVLEI